MNTSKFKEEFGCLPSTYIDASLKRWPNNYERVCILKELLVTSSFLPGALTNIVPDGRMTDKSLNALDPPIETNALHCIALHCTVMNCNKKRFVKV